MTVISPSAAWTYGADRVSKFADQLMDKIVEVFGTAGVPLPDRKFFTVGTPVYDCEELVVVFQGVRKGMTGGEDEPQNCDAPSTATFQAHLVRCFPVPQDAPSPPPANVLTKSADELMVDAWLMLRAADELNRDPFTSLGGMIYSVNVGEPSGGLVGVVLDLQAMVP
jgi:hypothetical protein